MTRPATEKQKRYAEAIAKLLRIPLPAEDSISAYSDFISRNKSEYDDMYHEAMNDYEHGWYESVDVPNM